MFTNFANTHQPLFTIHIHIHISQFTNHKQLNNRLNRNPTYCTMYDRNVVLFFGTWNLNKYIAFGFGCIIIISVRCKLTS